MTQLQAYASFFSFWTIAAVISVNALYYQKNIYPPLRNEARPGSSVLQTNFRLVYAIQRELKQRSYGIEKVSGVQTLETRGAIMAYQKDFRLPLTAEASSGLLQHILFGGNGTDSEKPVGEPSKKALKIGVSVQQSLLEMGYSAGPLGSLDHPLLDKAIISFEKDWKLPVTGRISGRLVKTLKRVAGLKIKIQ